MKRQWQPIETAPKDGSWFLAWRREWLTPVIVRVRNARFYTSGGVRILTNLQPTHWMLLPDPPEDEK